MTFRGILHAIGEKFGIGIDDPPIPATAVTITAGELLKRVQATDNPDAWHGYRLVAAGDARPRAVDEQWPRIVDVHLLRTVQGNHVGILVEAAPGYTRFEVSMPDSPVTIVPPADNGDIIL